MTANTNPIYTLTPDVSTNAVSAMAPTLTAAAADYTGISANNVVVHTAGTNGSYVRRLRFKGVSTNVAAVARVYINNGATNGTATNNSFYGEVSLPATTATTTSPTVEIDYTMEFALPAGFRIYVGLGAAVAGGWTVTAIAGQY